MTIRSSASQVEHAVGLKGIAVSEPCANRSGGEHDGRRRHEVVRTVMFADAEDIEANVVGELDLLEKMARALSGRDGLAVRSVARKVREGSS